MNHLHQEHLGIKYRFLIPSQSGVSELWISGISILVGYPCDSFTEWNVKITVSLLLKLFLSVFSTIPSLSVTPWGLWVTKECSLDESRYLGWLLTAVMSNTLLGVDMIWELEGTNIIQKTILSFVGREDNKKYLLIYLVHLHSGLCAKCIIHINTINPNNKSRK